MADGGRQGLHLPRPDAQWMALKWFFLSVPRSDTATKDWSWPQRGAYPQNIWARDDKSGGGYFSIGLGVADGEQKSAILWFYDHSGLKAADEKAGTPLDTPSPYPHHSILSFVDWPLDGKEKDPGGVLPHAYRDSKWGFYAWRNRWQDENDTVISVLTKGTKGNYSCKAENTLSIVSGGKHRTWGRINGGFTGDYQPAKDGSTLLTCGDGSCLAVAFSKASGADALLAIAGPSAAAAPPRRRPTCSRSAATSSRSSYWVPATNGTSRSRNRLCRRDLQNGSPEAATGLIRSDRRENAGTNRTEQ